MQKKRELATDADYSFKPFDDYKCIFVHIPKCAGISVCKSLFGNLGGGHLSIRKYQIVFSRSEFSKYFKYTFVRNPWDRIVSAYYFLKEGGQAESDRKWAEKNLYAYSNFDRFVKEGLHRRNIQSWSHFIPQYKFICNSKGKPLIDFVGYYENLEKDYLHIQKKIGVHSSLLRYNKTRSRKDDYRKYYTDETKEIVA
jgi:hypothetical protein